MWVIMSCNLAIIDCSYVSYVAMGNKKKMLHYLQHVLHVETITRINPQRYDACAGEVVYIMEKAER